MGNKKIGAYVVDEYGQYLKDEQHRLKNFYIWEALRLRENNIHNFNKLKFMSTQRDPAKRAEMSVVKNGFYRYKSAVNNADNSNDDDSLSHSIAIQVLSEMEEINFVCGNDRYIVNVNDIRLDDLKIQLTNRDKYDYYYPDLICFFNSPDSLALKWGGKVAIEVKHTHSCEKEKVYDFEDHGIPIIEVSIDKISIESVLGTKSPSPDQLEKYYSYLKNIFCKQVYGRVISDPVSVSYYKKEERQWKVGLDDLQAKIEVEALSVSKLKYQNEIKCKEIDELKKLIKSYEEEVLRKKERISVIENRGLGYFLGKKLGICR